MSYKFRILNHFGCFRNILHKCNLSMAFNGLKQFKSEYASFTFPFSLFDNSSRHYTFLGYGFSSMMLQTTLTFHKCLMYNVFFRNNLGINQIIQLIWDLSLSWLISPLNGTVFSSLTSSMLLPSAFFKSLHVFHFTSRLDFKHRKNFTKYFASECSCGELKIMSSYNHHSVFL